ncbi:alpha/beta hydrolase [Stakelama marina]|uniref:Alpha/beta hydrolase n=1 Tax=Stakelama marina TaxID=2826939 RepID=A0A8T4IE69_9SPHN|nr:alpha/beta hydrolase [Stakelama marina]MBR0552362.1 alpha/beta hydrolase [Stakelama marina]
MTTPSSLRRTIPSGARISEWRAPDGWPLRRFDWPAEAGAQRGSILFQGGRGDIVEKYFETFHHWHAQGWSLTWFDWRGQGGSGRITDNPHCGDIEDFADYIGDLRAFWRDWAESATGPKVVMGHSMGGHLILRGLVEGAISPDAAVLIAPMLGLKAPINAGFGEWLARLMGSIGKPTRLAWKANEKPHTTATREALLTHDHERYLDEIYWQTEKPELLLGPPSWRWLIEAFRSTRGLRENPALPLMKVPLLAVIADADRLVDPKAAAAIVGKLPNARTVRFGDESAHEILREVDPVRDRAIAAIDAFLTERAPPL